MRKSSALSFRVERSEARNLRLSFSVYRVPQIPRLRLLRNLHSE